MSDRFALSCLVVLAACSESPRAAPDAGVFPRNPNGTFSVTTRFDLAAPIPGPAAAILGDLMAMTDAPDDPSRYLVDRVVASLPDGAVKNAAHALAPFVAAYLNDRLMMIAPQFVSGVRGISAGLDHVARHFATVDGMRIMDAGATRTIESIRLELGAKPVDIAWSVDAGASLRVTLDKGGHLAFSEHVMSLAYGRMLRIALDTIVIPSVDPAATELSKALRDLVDCVQVGKLLAERVGVGSATLYEAACSTGMTAAASDFYRRLSSIDGSELALHMTGTAHAIDLDGSGTMDAFDSGNWTGSVGYGDVQAPLGPTLFSGTRQ